jgi:hypothetical protein
MNSIAVEIHGFFFISRKKEIPGRQSILGIERIGTVVVQSRK